MSEPENFLARWSRRKAEAADEHAEPAAAASDATTPENTQDPAAPLEADKTAAQAEAPAFDLSSLPSIESIVAGTDIKAFLQAGVPAELTRAALRRAWANDPTIRDFVGLSENSWDFTTPGGVPGFGTLSADEASRLMARFSSVAQDAAGKAKNAIDILQTDEHRKAAETLGDQGPQIDSPRDNVSQGNARIASVAEQKADGDAANSLQCKRNDVATQNNCRESDENSPRTRRGHGGALPR